MHRLWLNITCDPKFAGAHHYHIVALALEELQRELHTEQRATPAKTAGRDEPLQPNLKTVPARR